MPAVAGKAVISVCSSQDAVVESVLGENANVLYL
jgi:hypothetical protein